MAKSSDSVLAWLEEHYLSQCDAEWEHQSGYTIQTLDNPGWIVDFDLKGPLQNKMFQPVKIQRSENDWIDCRIEGKIFRGAGGPKNLTEVLVIFRNWATNSEGER